jgi:hypothetical protein
MPVKCLNLRGLFSLAAAVAVTSTALAADSFYADASAGLASADYASAPAGISDAGVNRLLEVNSMQDSVLGSHRLDASSELSSNEESSEVMVPFADATDNAPSGLYLVLGVGTAFAMGLGLCFAGLMSGRKRTINTFVAGYVQSK